ncbi:MAG: hypothetical protein AAGK47_05295, partial [Bacteroidota bacterium]
ATRFIQVFKDWITKHTSGVVIVQIASSEQADIVGDVDERTEEGLVESLFNPIGIAGQIFNTQKFEHDNSIGFISDILGPAQLDIVRFIYRPANDEKNSATVSFHISERERQDILHSFYLPENQKKVQHLQQLLR